MRTAGELVLGAASDSVRRARGLARELTGAASAWRDDVELVIAELVSNALLHGRPPVTVRLLDSADFVRVEVEDKGAAMPVRPRFSTESMTGRGFALVAALSQRWGVDPVADGGKTVWAEIGDDAGGQVGELDADDILASWSDEPAASVEPRFTVQLGAVPTELLLQAKSHIDDVVRELKLVQARASGDGDVLPAPLVTLIQSVTEDFAEARNSIKRQALEAAADGRAVTELALRLPVSAADAGERYLAALEEIDRQSRAGHMLTLAPPRSHQAFRRWYLQSLVDQLRSAARGVPTEPPVAFPLLLASQLDELVEQYEAQKRLQVLQALNRRLTECRSVTEMAEAVVESAAGFDGVESVRVYGFRDAHTLVSLAWHGGPPNSTVFSSFRVDEELPGAESVRTGIPLHVRTMADLHDRFPRLAAESPYPDDRRSLHNVPLRVAGNVIGLLTMTCRVGEVADAAQREFAESVGDAVAQAMERASATERADAERKRELALLGAQAEALTGVLANRPLVEVLDRLLLAVQDASAEGMLASVLLLDDDGQHLRHGSAPSLPADYNAAIDGIEIGPAVGSCGTAAYSRQRVIVDDILVDPRWAEFKDLASAAGLRACWSTPITSASGDLLGTFALYYRQPHSPTVTDLAFIDVLVSTVALIIERSRLRTPLAGEAAQRLALELAVTYAGVGTFDWDLVTGDLIWDDQLLDIFGITGSSRVLTIEVFYELVHPGDRERVGGLLAQAIESVGTYEAEYRIVTPSGELRWVAARGRAIAGPSGTSARLLGAAYDTTAGRESEARIARVMDSLSTAFFFLDRDWRFTFVNAEAERVLGRRRDELLGKVIWTEFPASVGSDFESHYRHAVDASEPVAFDAYYPEPLNAWYEVRAWPSPDGLAVYFIDVTDRRRAQEAAQHAIDRAGLLARVSEELASTLEPTTNADSLARIVLPLLGDWSVVTLIEDGHAAGTRRGLGHTVGHHVDPAKADLVQRYASTRLRRMTNDALVSRAVESAQPQIVNGDGMPTLREMFVDADEIIDMLVELGTGAIAVLPLIGQEQPVGMLSIVRAPESGPFSDEDLGLMRDVAARAGLVLDRARLYRQQREVAESLQRSLLSVPRAAPDVEVAVRYVPAAEISQVGGDWYDAFRVTDGATALVIGDVMGHDVLAAAAMGEARTLLRTLTAEQHGEPGLTLDSTEAVIRTLGVDILATAILARLDPAVDGVHRLRFANAGHPPPVLVEPNGRARVLDGPGSPLLGLGTLGHPEIEEALPAGSTLLLYTDGLVERRGQSIDDGIERLVGAVTGLAGMAPEQLADEVLRRLLPERSEDDVALLVVRV